MKNIYVVIGLSRFIMLACSISCGAENPRYYSPPLTIKSFISKIPQDTPIVRKTDIIDLIESWDSSGKRKFVGDYIAKLPSISIAALIEWGGEGCTYMKPYQSMFITGDTVYYFQAMKTSDGDDKIMPIRIALRNDILCNNDCEIVKWLNTSKSNVSFNPQSTAGASVFLITAYNGSSGGINNSFIVYGLDKKDEAVDEYGAILPGKRLIRTVFRAIREWMENP